MSASTKRKNRLAEIEAGTYKKQTAQRQRDEKQAKERRTIMICVCVAVVIFLAAILLNLIPWIKNKQVERTYTNGVAVTIGDRSYSPAEISYLYNEQAMQLYEQAYTYQQYGYDMYGLDLTNGIKGIGAQAFNKSLYADAPYETWRDYLLDTVYSQLKQVQLLLGYAKENGIELTKEETKSVESTLDQIKQQATEYGYSSADQFLSLNYGTGVSLKTVRALELETALASKAYTAYQDSLSYTADELAAEYEAELSDSNDIFTYAYYKVTVETEEAEEAEEVEEAEVIEEAEEVEEVEEAEVAEEVEEAEETKETEETEETEEAEDTSAAEAEAEADAILAAYQDGGDIEDLFERFNCYIEEELGDSAELKEEIKGSSLGSVYGDWLKDRERQAGDVTKVQNDSGEWIVVMFLDRENGADYNTVNVRHILVKTTQSDDGTWSDEAIAEAKAEAERILAEWEAGDKTEESFAALAEQYSTDAGSNTKGGLYENVYRGQMVTEFNDFCFAEGRKAGDVGIVHGNNGSYDGYHVIYFSGESERYCDMLAKDSLTNKALSEFLGREIALTVGEGEALVDPITTVQTEDTVAQTEDTAAQTAG